MKDLDGLLQTAVLIPEEQEEGEDQEGNQDDQKALAVLHCLWRRRICGGGG
jgi:hypothetical protein